VAPGQGGNDLDPSLVSLRDNGKTVSGAEQRELIKTDIEIKDRNVNKKSENTPSTKVAASNVRRTEGGQICRSTAGREKLRRLLGKRGEFRRPG